MINEFLSETYYGNSLSQWLLALLILVGSLVIARILYWMFGRWLKKLAQNTTTHLDDILIDKLEEPVVAIVVAFGLRYAITTLTIQAEMATFVDNIFRVALVLILTWLILRIYEAIHDEYIAPVARRSQTDLDDALLPVLRSGVRIIVITLGVLVALNNAGYDIGTVLAGLGIGGLAFALAAQDLVSNFFGGVTIFASRPFLLGDRIRIGGAEGYVREIGIRNTTLQTLTGVRIFLPNKLFISEVVENLDVAHFYFDNQVLRLDRETPTEEIEALLAAINEAGKSIEQLVWIDAIYLRTGEYSLDLMIKYGIAQWKPGQIYNDHMEKIGKVSSQVNLTVLKIVRARGVELAKPIMTLADYGAFPNMN